MNIGKKITTFFCIILTIPLLLFLILINYNNFNEEYKQQQYYSSIKSDVNSVEEIFKSEFFKLQELSSDYNFSELFKNTDNSDNNSMDTFRNNLAEFKDSMPKIKEVYLVNSSDKIILSTNSENPKKISDISLNNKFSFNSNYFVFLSSKDSEQNGSNIAAIIPMLNGDDNKIGELVVILDSSEIIDKIKNSDFISDYFILSDKNNGTLKILKGNRAYSQTFKTFATPDFFEGQTQIFNTQKNYFKNKIVFDELFITYGEQSYADSGLSVFTITRAEKLTGMYNIRILILNIICVSLFAAIYVLMIIFIKKSTSPIKEYYNIINKTPNNKLLSINLSETSNEFLQVNKEIISALDSSCENEYTFNTTAELCEDILFEIDLVKDTVRLSNNFYRKFHFDAMSSSIADSFFHHADVHENDNQAFISDFNKILTASNYLDEKYRIKDISGNYVWYQFKATKYFNKDQLPCKIIGVIIEANNAAKDEKALIKEATYDCLTQIYNRSSFLKNLEEEFFSIKQNHCVSAVFFLDLDDFKHFNDNYGHVCGDEVLIFTANSIKQIVHDRGFVGRFGGDEFVICIPDITDKHQCSEICEQIIRKLSEGFDSIHTDARLCINCSIGVAFITSAVNTYQNVLNMADEAMYSVKKHGKSNFTFSDQNINL